MKVKKNPYTETDNYEEWVTTKICNDLFIQSLSKDILDSPKFIFSSTDSKIEKEQLYTVQQMLEMFRAGFLSVTRTDFGKEVVRKAKRGRVPDNPYRILRTLDINSTTTFPFRLWQAVRSAASKLKKDFGATYKVNKLGKTGQVGDIEVTRLS